MSKAEQGEVSEDDIRNLAAQISNLRYAILTLTAWLAQSHVFGEQDVRQMEKILGLGNGNRKD